MVHSAARLRTTETESDALGQLAASKSRHSVGQPTQPSGYQPQQTPEQHQAELFARGIASFLLKGRQDGLFGKLVLAAPPEFLGVLRKQLDSQLDAAIVNEINKDYTHLNATELRERLETQQEKEERL